MIVLRDVAGILGVSPGTVSKALRGIGDVGTPLCEEIKSVAEQIGYRSKAGRRRARRTGAIGVIYEVNNASRDPWLEHVFHSLMEQAQKSGYDTLVMSMRRTARIVSYLAQARYRKLEAVCILQADLFAEKTLDLLYSEIPVLVLEESFPLDVAISEKHRRSGAATRMVRDRRASSRRFDSRKLPGEIILQAIRNLTADEREEYHRPLLLCLTGKR